MVGVPMYPEVVVVYTTSFTCMFRVIVKVRAMPHSFGIGAAAWSGLSNFMGFSLLTFSLWWRGASVACSSH